MEGRSSAGQSPDIYQSAQWTRLVRRNTFAAPVTPLSSTSTIVPIPQFSSPLDFLPSLLPQQSPAAFQQQLANYNKLVESGGRSTRGQSSPLPPQLPAGQFLATPRRVSSSHDSSNNSRSSTRGNGNKKSPRISKGERMLMTTEENTSTMADRKHEVQKQLPTRSLIQQHPSSLTQQSNSVPSTPHQRSRKFSLSSREPSPITIQNHSPRSAYSETTPSLPSLRPLPPRLNQQCKHETAMQFSRRRMAYSIGTDRLDTEMNVKAELNEQENRQLAIDMRELYNRLLPTPTGEANRTKFVLKLEKMLNDEWPGHDIKVHLFGSSGNMLCTDDSDVDICITTAWRELENVCKLAELLARNGMEKVICVSTAKVPIVKVWDPELNLACDMNVNNTLALENTRMLKTYVKIDERVRPLAIIIKYWTKRRIVNDAAFGATLSSYTWICMVINFLQTRRPPILPALHKRPHQRPSRDSHDMSFDDDVEKFKDFGKDNKEDIAQLLFHFFRFYAHEMDFDKLVVSVRNGGLILKTDKGWHLATNNMLCVEEPFNTMRNLANTADDTSFRGIHMELRRAFDLVAGAKLDTCCEQYVFPKEEERVWERPTPQPRPIISRTPSQTSHKNGGARGRGNFQSRGGRNYNGNNRRVSTGAYDNQNIAQQFMQHPQAHVSAEWLAAQSQMHTDLSSQLSQLKAQENSLRSMLYQQSQQYAQMQAQAHYQATRNGANPSSERNRGQSFDNPPLTAPLRPELAYFYPMVQPAAVYQTHTAYPSSPSMSPALPDMRHSNHRAAAASAPGIVNASGSTHRSHSQPASRSSQPSASGPQGVSVTNWGVMPHVYQQHANGVPTPVFMSALENGDGHDFGQFVPPSTSPPNNLFPKEYVGYFVHPPPCQPPSSPLLTHQSQPPKESLSIPTYGENNQGHRRLSGDQLTIFERVRRNSRSPSPSPLSHNGMIPNDTSGFPMRGAHTSPRVDREAGPVIVNGSSTHSHALLQQRSLVHEKSMSEDQGHGATNNSFTSLSLEAEATVDGEDWVRDEDTGKFTVQQELQPHGPVVANGSHLAMSGHQTPMVGLGINAVTTSTGFQPSNLNPNGFNGALRAPPITRRDPRSQPNGGISPLLDIGQLPVDLLRDDLPHLSPVYEAQSPSPVANRKGDVGSDYLKSKKIASVHGIPETIAGEPASLISKGAPPTKQESVALKLAVANSQKTTAASTPRANGHKSSKSDGSSSADRQWSTPRPKQKKKNPVNGLDKSHQTAQTVEKMPVKESDRKGG